MFAAYANVHRNTLRSYPAQSSVVVCGYCGYEATTVVELFDEAPNVIRQGLGDSSAFEA